MHVSQALNTIKPNQVEILADLLPIELINSAYELTDTVTLRKRDRKSTRLNSSHSQQSRMPSSA